MTYGQMVDRIVAFKKGVGEGRFLRDVDSRCADALNRYWDMFGPHGLKPSQICIDALFRDVENKLSEGACT